MKKLTIPKFQRESKYHMSQIEKYRKHIVEDTDVIDGVYYWKRSGNIVPVCVFTNDAFLQPPVEHVAAYEKDRDESLAAYRERMKNHVPSGEELYEMRAAFGTGVTVVNVITGKKTKL